MRKSTLRSSARSSCAVALLSGCLGSVASHDGGSGGTQQDDGTIADLVTTPNDAAGGAFDSGHDVDSAVAPDAGATWTGKPLYMAVGYDGVRALSQDGVTFSTTVQGATAGDGQNLDDQYNFRAVAYANGRFVAVGGGCLPPYSTCPSRIEVMKSDLTWNAVWTPTNNDHNWLGGVASDGQHWVAVGGLGPVAYSADGDNWTFLQNNTGKVSAFRAVAWGGGVYVAVGDGGSSGYSTDGQAWTITDNGSGGSSRLTSVVYGGSQFAAIDQAGQLHCTPDGKTWTAPGSFGSEIDGFAYGGGKFVVSLNGSSYTSSSCTTWPWTKTSEQNGPGNVVHYTHVGGVGTFYGLSWVDTIATSTAGASWNKATVTASQASAFNNVASTED